MKRGECHAEHGPAEAASDSRRPRNSRATAGKVAGLFFMPPAFPTSGLPAKLEGLRLNGTSRAGASRECISPQAPVVAAAGLLLRVAVVLTVPTQPTSDFWSYYHGA